MKLTEYIYIDERRVNSYFEQLWSPVTYDKVPTWKAGLSLTGPAAEGTQLRFARPFTQYEKIATLMKEIKPARELELPFREYSDFVFTSIRGKRVFLPPAPEWSPKFKGLAIWICGDTYLIEDFPRDDDRRRDYSGMTAMFVFFEDLQKELEQTKVPSISQRGGKEIAARFIQEPDTLFSEWGGEVGVERHIDTLFRVRKTMIDDSMGYDNAHHVVIGYP